MVRQVSGQVVLYQSGSTTMWPYCKVFLVQSGPIAKWSYYKVALNKLALLPTGPIIPTSVFEN